MKRLLLISVKLLCITPCCLFLWGLVMPGYASCIGMRIAYIPGLSIEQVSVTPGGMFNTGCQLSFTLAGAQNPLAIQIAPVVLNLPLFIALALTTFRFPVKSSLIATSTGCGILSISHIAFLVFALGCKDHIAAAPEFPTALGQLLFCLPFLLWLFFFYRDIFPLSDQVECRERNNEKPPLPSDSDGS